MKISYDPRVDAAYIRLRHGRFQVTTQRLTEDVAVNFAPDGSVVGIEVLDASKYLIARHHRFLRHQTPQVELENLQPVRL